MPSLSLLVRSCLKPSWWCTSKTGERGFTHVRSPKQAADTQVHRSRREERRELLDDTANLLPLLECHSEQEKLSMTEKGKFCASTPRREPGRSQNLQAGLPHLSPCESYRKKKTNQNTPNISNLTKVTRNNQSRFVIYKSSLTTLFAFSDELSLNGRSTLAALHANSSEVSDTVSLVAKQETWTEYKMG